MAKHAVKPSVDLEGNHVAGVDRSRSILSLRSRSRSRDGRQLATDEPSRGSRKSERLSPRQIPYPSPPHSREPSPSRFSTLPPSPPRPFLNLPDPLDDESTPPPSAPGSSRFGAIFQARLQQSSRSCSPSSLTSISIDEAHSQPGNLSRRPSFVVTEAPATEGLAINLDLSASLASPLPSPRLPKRSYPTEPSTSPLVSPLITDFPAPTSSSASPAWSSPGTFLSPVEAFPSPLLDVPSSPRLGAALTEPVSKLIRRASTSSLRAELPLASPTIPSQPSSPLLRSSPGLAVTSALPRKASFASQSRDREQEKVKEKAAKDSEAKKKAYHNRMFSWAVRPEDLPKEKQDARAGRSSRRRGLLLVCGVALLVYWTCFAGDQTPRRDVSAPTGETLRVPRRVNPRSQAVGRSFIHPDVISRPHTRKLSYRQMAWAWLGSLASSPPAHRSQAVFAVDSAPTNRRTKLKNVFVPAKPVAFEEHRALPPPPGHSAAPERDTLVLYRILGNDLPPRHSPDQTLRNLRFLLQHESDFTNLPHLGPHTKHHATAYEKRGRWRPTDEGGLRVDKYFVLNRIADPDMLAAIHRLLQAFSVPDSRILILPFDFKEYQRRDFKWDGNVAELASWDVGSGNSTENDDPFSLSTKAALQHASRSSLLSEMAASKLDAKKRRALMIQRLRALDYTYHEKNLYAMNNNGGRNFALQHGRSLPHARWILPLDGNSFFTPAAMHSIVQALSIAGEGDHASRYVVIPMSRLLANEDVLHNNTRAVTLSNEHVHSDLLAELDSVASPPEAPKARDEPQIGFRFDSTETYQEAMRYGRRSKLELLWRLGAIPYARGLDRRTLPWEQSDRDHITRESWGSIPGVDGADTSKSAVYLSHGDFTIWSDPDPPRGPVAFVKAGWVYRLFSGSKEQEGPTPDAINLRNFNRIRGIVAFLERLDEGVARGDAGCTGERAPCGFDRSRLWNFNSDTIEKTREKFAMGRRDARDRVEAFEERASPVNDDVMRLLSKEQAMSAVDAQMAATNATILALAGHLSGNSSYTETASQLIQARFVRQVPLFYRQNEQREMLSQLQVTETVLNDFDAAGHSFPAPVQNVGKNAAWNAILARHLAGSELPALPFDPLTFDPSLLLDAVRLLESPYAPRSKVTITRKTVKNMFTAHLSYLLFSPDAIDLSRDPPSAQVGAFYDARVAALAAFLDDARLVGRVANRARLRLPLNERERGLFGDSRRVRAIHPMLVHGLNNVRFRPYSLASHEIAERGFGEQVWGEDSPLNELLDADM